MSTNLSPNPNNANIIVQQISWRKKYRPQLMNISFLLFGIGFPLSYWGGIDNNLSLITLSFITFSIACIIPLITKK